MLKQLDHENWPVRISLGLALIMIACALAFVWSCEMGVTRLAIASSARASSLRIQGLTTSL
jgi:hypothetical protein